MLNPIKAILINNMGRPSNSQCHEAKGILAAGLVATSNDKTPLIDKISFSVCLKIIL